METTYFTLRFGSLTAELDLPADQQQTAVTAAETTFEELRRLGSSVAEAIEVAESVLMEQITPTLEAASRLQDILFDDFATSPDLARAPHFPLLLAEFMPLLKQPQSRLADAYLVGLIADYQDKHLLHGL